MSSPRIGIGLVGLGFGSNLLRALGTVKNARIVALYDTNAAQLNKYARKYKCRAAVSLEELIKDPDIQAVVLATPNFLHREQVLAAAAAGKHVFVDKPIANTLKDAFIMHQACRKKRVILAVGHNSRHQRSVNTVRKFIKGGTLGKVSMVETNFSSPSGLELKPNQWRWYKDKCPSGPLMQLGVHEIDNLIYLFGPIIKVSALFNRLATPAEIDDATVTIFQFASGVLGYNGSGYCVTPVQVIMNVYGTKATLCVRPYGLEFQHLRRRATLRKLPLIKTMPLPFVGDYSGKTLVMEMQHFVDAAAGKKSAIVTAADAIRALAVVEAAIISNKTGATVDVRRLVKKYDTKFTI